MKTTITINGVDHEYPKGYDTWEELWKADPVEFERQRLEILDLECQRMAGGDEDVLLKRKQFVWKMNQTLNKYKNDTARLNKMAEMLWTSVDDFVYSSRTGKRLNEPKQNEDAVVLDLEQKRKQKTDE